MKKIILSIALMMSVFITFAEDYKYYNVYTDERDIIQNAVNINVQSLLDFEAKDSLYYLNEEGIVCPRYENSDAVVAEVFPIDEKIVLHSNEEGFVTANKVKEFLIGRGWDEDLVKITRDAVSKEEKTIIIEKFNKGKEQTDKDLIFINENEIDEENNIIVLTNEENKIPDLLNGYAKRLNKDIVAINSEQEKIKLFNKFNEEVEISISELKNIDSLSRLVLLLDYNFTEEDSLYCYKMKNDNRSKNLQCLLSEAPR